MQHCRTHPSLRASLAAASAAALVVLAACSERRPDPVEVQEGDPVAATVSLASPSVAVGSETQANVVLLDDDGMVVDTGATTAYGDTVVWSVVNASIARVDASGRVSGVALGTTRVVATWGRLRGEGELTVTGVLHPRIDSIRPAALVAGLPATLYGADFVPVPSANVVSVGGTRAVVGAATATALTFVVPESDCVPASHRTVSVSASGQSAWVDGVAVAPAVTPLLMPAGAVRVLAGAAAVGCVHLAASDAPSDYLIVAANANPVTDKLAVHTMGLAVGDSAAIGVGRYGAEQPAALRVADASGAAAAASLAWRFGDESTQISIDQKVRAAARRLLTPRAAGGASASTRSATRGPAGGLSLAVASAAPAVGAVLALRVPKLVEDVCANYDSVQAVVKYVGRRAVFAQDLAAPEGFADADYAALSAELDDLVYPVDSSYFGTPTDLDANGRVLVLFTPLINKLTPRRSGSVQGGFFWSGDLFPRAKCEQSNVGEIFYLLTPDPAAQFGDARPVADTRLRSRGTIAHELQHMINAGARITRGAPTFESVWLDEALSHFAEEAVGRTQRGFGDSQRLSYADVAAEPSDYESFFRQNILRLAAWMRSPGDFSPTSIQVAGSVEGRGAVWSLLRYAADHYAGGDVRAFTRKLVATSDTSVANLVARAGVPFDSLMSGWMVATVGDGFGLSAMPERQTFGSWNLSDALTAGGARPFPLSVTPLDPEGLPPTLVYSGTGVYYRLTFSGPRYPAASFRLLGTNGLPASFEGARLYVVRLR